VKPNQQSASTLSAQSAPLSPTDHAATNRCCNHALPVLTLP
jgi:hypothetical protein